MVEHNDTVLSEKLFSWNSGLQYRVYLDGNPLDGMKMALKKKKALDDFEAGKLCC